MIWTLLAMVVVLFAWCYYNSIMLEGVLKRIEIVETRKPSMRDALRERFREAARDVHRSTAISEAPKSGRETLREHLVARGKL